MTSDGVYGFDGLSLLNSIRRFWKFKFTNYADFTNAESPFKCTYGNNTSNLSIP